MGPKFRRRPQVKKGKIASAFEQLVEERGYEDVTMKQIADTAEVSVGTIYRYFPEGKSDIVKALFERNVDGFVEGDDFVDIFMLVLKGQTEGIRLFVRQYYRGHLESYGNYKKLGLVLANQGSLFQNFGEEMDRYIDFYIEKLDPNDLALLPDEDTIRGIVHTLVNTVEALVHHQIFNSKIMEDDDDFVNYLTAVSKAAINHMTGSTV